MNFRDKVYWVLVILYAGIFLYHPSFGPIDSCDILETLQVGKPLHFFIFPSIGRFHPLDGQEYNIIPLFLRFPFAYYFYNMLQFLVLAYVLLRLLKKTGAPEILCYLSAFLFFLVPGFVSVWFDLLYGERNVVFFFALFLLNYLTYQETRRFWNLAAGLLCANIALYYKEPAFLLLGVFAAAHMFFTWKRNDFKQRMFDGLCVLSAFVCILIYSLLVLPHITVLYGSTTTPLLTFLKGGFNAGLTDPVLMFLLVPLLLYRSYSLLRGQKVADPLYDSMLLASGAYMAVFVKLNLYGAHNLLPVYLFALPPLLFFLTGKETGWFWKFLKRMAGFFWLTGSLLMGIHLLTFYKFVSINYNQMLDFLVKDIEKRPPTLRNSIFLEGINTNTGEEFYVSLGKFLQYRGVPLERFDLKSNEESSRLMRVSFGTNFTSPYSVFRSDKIEEPASGDYLLVTPYSLHNINRDYLQSLEKNYDLIFKTVTPLAIPNINLQSIFKLFVIRMQKSELFEGGHKNVIYNENILSWPDYYVFVKK